MKKLLLVLFVPIFVVLGTPALIAGIMYDASEDTAFTEMAERLYFDGADAEEMLLIELDNSISDVEDGTTADLELGLHEDIINTAIFQAILETNPDYMPTAGCDDDACNYIVSEPVPIEGFDISIRLVGAWVELEATTIDNVDYGRIIFKTLIEVQLNDGFTYKTVVAIQFLVSDTLDDYTVEFEKVKLGNLPLPKSLFVSIYGIIDDQFPDLDLESNLDDLPIGDFVIDDMKYTVTKDEIIDEIGEVDPGEETETGIQVAQELLAIIFDERLLFFEFADEEWAISAGVSRFRNDAETDIPDYLYDMHDVNGFNATLFDPQAYLEDRFTAYMFNSALTNDGFILSEEMFNKLIYYEADGFAETRTTKTYTIDGVEKEVNIGLNAMWFEIDADGIDVKALFEISGIKSILNIRAENVTPDGVTDELIFEFNNINFGYDEGDTPQDFLLLEDLDVFLDLFVQQGEMEIGTFNADNTFTISAVGLTETMTGGTNEGVIEVTGISLIDGALVIDMQPTDQALQDALAAVGAELEAVLQSQELIDGLEDLLDTVNPGPEQDVYNNVIDLQNALGDPEQDVTAEDIETLFESFDQLDAATQEAFLQEFENLIDPAIFDDYEGLFTPDE
ncbi:MAG: hypothetical protein QM489_03450 [Candidatus Izemoplasma sp.]